MTSRQPTSLRAFIDAAADAVAREIATVRREAEEVRVRAAELDARIAMIGELEMRLAGRLETLKDGADGKSFRIRGTWLEINEYETMDVVALNGASFAARRDGPGPCPGEGWQLIAAQGKRGEPGKLGLAGDKGKRGEPGPPVVALSVSDEGTLTLTNGDGSTVTCDLYPVLRK